MDNKRVGGRLWGDVCREWWDNFSKMCAYAWQTDWLSGGEVGRLRECSIRMGKAHLVLQWPKLLWSHLWIDHMYFFAYVFLCLQVENPPQIFMLCHGRQPP